jgi:AhpD family alkylhydroperoxidase
MHMQLDERIARLIAVGASVAAGCQPCLSTNAQRALAAGASLNEIAEAITIGKTVRRGAASKMDAFIAELGASAVAEGSAGGCGCGEAAGTS